MTVKITIETHTDGRPLYRVELGGGMEFVAIEQLALVVSQSQKIELKNVRYTPAVDAAGVLDETDEGCATINITANASLRMDNVDIASRVLINGQFSLEVADTKLGTNVSFASTTSGRGATLAVANSTLGAFSTYVVDDRNGMAVRGSTVGEHCSVYASVLENNDVMEATTVIEALSAMNERTFVDPDMLTMLSRM